MDSSCSVVGGATSTAGGQFIDPVDITLEELIKVTGDDLFLEEDSPALSLFLPVVSPADPFPADSLAFKSKSLMTLLSGFSG